MKIWITGLSFSKNINEETVALCIHFIVLTWILWVFLKFINFVFSNFKFIFTSNILYQFQWVHVF
jgi:hypothetical protein